LSERNSRQLETLREKTDSIASQTAKTQADLRLNTDQTMKLVADHEQNVLSEVMVIKRELDELKKMQGASVIALEDLQKKKKH
jgi:flagellar motor switch/type III secretory pathway protein FliN